MAISRGEMPIQMLAFDCDLDDLYAVQSLIRTMNALGIPKNTITTLRRKRKVDNTTYRYATFIHTTLKNE